jgi:hypothetical protein
MLLWPLWHRHRLGLSLALGGVLASALTATLLPSRDVPSPNMLALLLLPVGLAAFYVVKVFCFASEAQVEAAESCFPTRLWALPVGTPTLVGWPMLAGQISVALLWLVVALGILRPRGIPAPVVCPALVFSAGLAWLQALLWWPFPLPWLRLWTLFALATGLAGLLGVLGDNGVLDERLLTALGAGALALAYPVAAAGVARGRRGAVAPWDLRLPRRWSALVSFRPGQPFRQPGQAQLWFEWRRNGWSLPIFTLTCAVLLLPLAGPAGTLPDELAQIDPSSPAGRLFVVVRFMPVLMTLLLPLFLAPGLGHEIGRMNLKRGKGPSSFFLARPLTSAALLRAKVLVAVLSVATTNIVLVVALACWLGLAGRLAPVQEAFRSLGQILSPGQQVGLALLFVLALPVLLWLHMMQGMWSGLIGNTWVQASNMLPIVASAALGLAAVPAAEDPAVADVLLSLLPWLALGAATGKLLAFIAICHLGRRRLLSWRSILAMVALWTALAVALSAFVLSFGPVSPTSISLLVLGLMLLIPVFRPLLAPLAIEWSRHR